MNPEEVRAAVQSRRRDGAVLRRINGLSGKLARLVGGGVPEVMASLLSAGFAQREIWDRMNVLRMHRGSLGASLVSLPEGDWKKLTDTLLPQLAPAAMAAQAGMLRHRTYLDGLSRVAFRCPRSPQTLTDTRARWLARTTLLLGDYDADIRWVAEHAAFLTTAYEGGTDIGWLLAGAIDAGGNDSAAVLDILRATASGEHHTAQMGRHVTQALLSCSHPDAWAFTESLLLSAQRAEGVRQVILESVDEAHPDAFRRMLRLILEHDLARFSSVVRAADVWFGFQWDGTSTVRITAILERVLEYLDSPAARAAALASDDAETVYLALWCTAFEDVDNAIAPAAELLRAPSAEHRYVAAHLLVQAGWSTALPLLMHALSDPDLRVATRALDQFVTDMTGSVDGVVLFDNIEAFLQRVPKRAQKLDAAVWPWCTRKLERSSIASALATNASAVPPERLLPHVPELDPWQREQFVRRTAGLPSRWASRADASAPRRALSASERGVLLELLGDASQAVRHAAFEALGSSTLEADELDRLIELLARKPSDLRTAALARLRTLTDAPLLAAADRLLSDAEAPRRLAGLELLRDAVEAGRCVTAARARLDRYATERLELSEPEQAHLAAGAVDAAPVASTDDALGLLAGHPSRPLAEPRALKVLDRTKAAATSLESLARVILEHQTTEVTTATGDTVLLVQTYLARPDARGKDGAPPPPPPLSEVWRTWETQRGPECRDRDGFELLRILLDDDNGAVWTSQPVREVAALGNYGAGRRFLSDLVRWCLAWQAPPHVLDFLLDGLESALTHFSAADFTALRAEQVRGYRMFYAHADRPAWQEPLMRVERWLGELRRCRQLFPSQVTPAHCQRLYDLLRYAQERSGGFDAFRVRLDDFLPAYAAGVADEADFIALLVGPWSTATRRNTLFDVSAMRPSRPLERYPALYAEVDRCRRRIVEVECTRGDRQSAASRLALELRWTGGLETLQRAIPALGKAHFARNIGWWSTEASRQDTLSHLVRRSVARPEDTPDAFAAWVRGARISDSRLIELALYAPQWAPHVSHVLGWEGLESAVWWFQAHTKEGNSWEIQDLREIWAAEISEHTALTATDLTEGAVDVAWFLQVHAQLGADRWKTLDAAAKYASTSGGHTRAQLFARAMAGLVTVEALQERITRSRHQDSVRALGLIPLSPGAHRETEVLTRYRALEEFRRQSRQFGAQRRESEGRAVDIGLENLARTAGYRDPQRLRWAMERAAVGDLALGPVVVTRDDVSATLAIDTDGVPGLSYARAGKTLKSAPASLKKDPEVQALSTRYQELKRQRSRVREALELAMCRGDQFTASELRTLLEHPVLAPALQRLVFIGDGIAGYLAERGHAVRDAHGALHALGSDEPLRIAHPADLLARGDWSAWQRECFAAERVQPFKQVFRELYPITEAERSADRSRRYAGHQVNPRQALAVLGNRGWVARPEEGVSRTDHDAGLTIRLGFQETFYTPADVEGLTLEDVIITRKGHWTPVPLADVPPRVFSEAMRDLDLTVSVAHSGGVDPEATASTVEMRATLVREACQLLSITNVEYTANHVIIRGALADYSVHLGSASVLVLPATAVPIVAVHSQHRGRMFLPFADDDPRTAEVLSKVLLLARDKAIRDPAILDRIRAARGAVPP